MQRGGVSVPRRGAEKDVEVREENKTSGPAVTLEGRVEKRGQSGRRRRRRRVGERGRGGCRGKEKAMSV